MKQLLVVNLLLLASSVQAQTASIKKVELAGDKIIIHYDLEDSDPNHEYVISLLSSQNNYTTTLTHVVGDVGAEIKSGTNKRIEWSVIKELGPYKGKLSLEVRGRVYTPVAKFFSGTIEDRKFKRGKSHIINWKPGNSNPVNIELLKDDHPVSSHVNQPNSGSNSLFIPPHIPTGPGYSIRITDTRNSSEFVTSPSFRVRHKFPLLLKILPVVAIAGVVSVFAASGDDGDPNGDDSIPGPPLPGN